MYLNKAQRKNLNEFYSCKEVHTHSQTNQFNIRQN